MSNVYYEPEHFGLETVGEIDRSSGYDFDLFVVWRDNGTGHLWFAEDSGCSCPSPFEDVSFANGLTEVHTLQQLIDAIAEWQADYWDQAEAKQYEGEIGSLIAKARSVATFSNAIEARP